MPMTALKHAVFNKTAEPAPDSYVEDGLICWWDGIDNAGPGAHSDSSTAWVNLGSIGESGNLTRSHRVDWGADCANFSRGYNNAVCFSTQDGFMPDYMKGEWTVEVVFTPDVGFFSNYSGVAGQHINVDTRGSGLVFIQYGDGLVSMAVFDGVDRCGCIFRASDVIQSGKTVSFSCAASGSRLSFDGYRNGEDASGLMLSRKPPSSASDTMLENDIRFGLGSSAAVEDIASPERVFSGKIHCARIYDRALSAREVASNYMFDRERYTWL